MATEPLRSWDDAYTGARCLNIDTGVLGTIVVVDDARLVLWDDGEVDSHHVFDVLVPGDA